MKAKIFIVILTLGYIFQIFAEETEWDRIIELLRVALPFLLFAGAPIIIAVIIVVIIKLIGYGGKLSIDLFTDNDEDEQE